MVVSTRNSVKSSSVLLLSQKGYPALKRSEEGNHHLEQYLNPKGNFKDVDYLDYVMPGSANEPLHDWCGKWMRKGCLNVENHETGEVYLKQFQRSCYGATCPTCAHKWLARLAKQSSNRLMVAVKKYDCRLSHVMISIPSWLSDRSLKGLRKRAYVQLKKVGVTAGNLMFHAYRKKMVGDEVVWYYAPHFHGIMTGWIVGVNVADEYRDSGWIVKKIRTLESEDEIFPLMLYQLSHSSITKTKHSLTWFGDFSYGKLKVVKEDDTPLCPECQCGLVVLELTDKCLIKPDEEFDGLVPVDWVFSPAMVQVNKWNHEK